MKPLAHIVTAASAILCVLLLGTLVASYHMESRKTAVDLTQHTFIGVLDGSMLCGTPQKLFHGNMPHGGTLSHDGGEARARSDFNWTVGAYGSSQRTFIAEDGAFVARQLGIMLPGFFYGRLYLKEHPVHWSCGFSLWYPVVFLAGLPLLVFLRRWQSRNSLFRQQRGAAAAAGERWTA